MVLTLSLFALLLVAVPWPVAAGSFTYAESVTYDKKTPAPDYYTPYKDGKGKPVPTYGDLKKHKDYGGGGGHYPKPPEPEPVVTPEPTTLLLLGASLVGAGAVRKYRQRRGRAS